MNSKLMQKYWIIILLLLFNIILLFSGCNNNNARIDEERSYRIIPYKAFDPNDESKCVYGWFRTGLSANYSSAIATLPLSDNVENRKDKDVDNFVLIKEMAQTVLETRNHLIDSITGEDIAPKGDHISDSPIRIYVFDKIYKNWQNTDKTVSSLTDAELNAFKSEIEYQGIEVKVSKNANNIASQYLGL